MSQIDEAFIQAYATPQQPTNAPSPGDVPVIAPQPPLVGLHRGPHIQLPPALVPVSAFSPVQLQPATLSASQPTPQPTPLPIPALGQQGPLAAFAQVNPSAVFQAVPQTASQTPPPVFPQSPAQQQPQQPAAMPNAGWSPEPVPAPHFSMPLAAPQVLPQTIPAQNPSELPSELLAAQQAAVYATALHESAAWPPAIATAPPVAERRPLSAFAEPEQPTATAFAPVFEVDAFRWPTISDKLLHAHHDLLVPVAEQLLSGSEQGRSLVGFAGTRANVGCATLMISMARMLASVGKSVVMVDANFSKASLSHDLGLQFNTGWEQALTGQLPLAECVIKSLDDNMALLPLTRPITTAYELLSNIQTSVTAGILRYHYDVVLFNLGAAGQLPQQQAAQNIMQQCRLDASIIIADSDTQGTNEEQINPLMSIFGSTCLGIIGNSAVK